MHTNSLEVLQLLADRFESLLKSYLGSDCIFLLVIASDRLANCISNAPVHRADQLKNIFRQLAQRQPKLHN